MQGVAFSVVAVLAVVLGQANPSPKPSTVDEIAGWVKQLGADDFAQRQAATDALWNAGSASEAALREALKSSDAEVRYRAAAVLDKVKSGIRPDTPPDVAALIEQFRFGSDSVQRQALTELRNKGQWAVVLSLLRGEENLARRRNLALAIAPDAGKLVRPLVEQGQLAAAETILDLTAVNEAGLVQLTTFLLLTGRLDDAIAAVQARVATNPSEEDYTRLAWFLRGKGDLRASFVAAQKTTDKFLPLNLLCEARDWPQAAKFMEDLQHSQPTNSSYPPFLATFQRLAGNDSAYRNLLDDMTKRSKERAAGKDPFENVGLAISFWSLAETRLINEQPNEALPLLMEQSPEKAMGLLRARLQVPAALALGRVKEDTSFDGEWFKSLPAPAGDEKVANRNRFAVAAQTAQLLRELGRTAAVDQIIATLEALAAADSDDGRRYSALAKFLWQLGRYDDALEAAVLATPKLPSQQVFAEFIKPQAIVAGFWFRLATDIDPLADRQQALKDAVWISVPRPPQGKAVADWKQRVEGAAAHVRKLEPKVRAAYLAILAETCYTRGDRELSRKYYEEAAEFTPVAAIKAGDSYARDKNWVEAEKWYGKGAAASDGDALALFLQGWAVAQAGQVEAGQEKQRLASLTALAPDVRYALAAGLQERGLAADAVAQFEIVRRTAPLDSSLVVNAGQQVGNLTSGKEPLRAAECWEHLLLHVLNANSNFVEIEGYLTLPHVMHKVRAKGFLAQNKTAEALAEIAACQRMIPGDVKLVEDLVPLLDKAAFTADADKVFAAAHAIHAQLAKDYPNSAMYLNSTAWLCATARRKLDEALPLVRKALELAPQEAAYWDTLAEVHFQLGDRPAALTAARKCLELSPGNPLFEKRIKHFEQDEPGAAPSAEQES